MIKNRFKMSQPKRKRITTACLTFGTAWALGIAARPALAQNPDGSDPTPPMAGEADSMPEPESAEPQNPATPATGSPAAPQAAPFQQPKAESLSPRVEAPGANLNWIPRSNLSLSYNLQSSAMAAKTRRILALREMLKLGLTASDIEKALPLLRRLRDAESQPPANPEQALEDEYQALLRAKPGDPLPPSSALKLQDAARFYRDEQGNVWGELTKQIGAKKAEGLRELVGQNTTFLYYNNGSALNASVNYRAPMTTYLQSTTTLRPGYATPYGFSQDLGSAPKAGTGPTPDSAQGTTPAAPAAKPGKRERRGTRRSDPTTAPATPAPGAAMPSGANVAGPFVEYGQGIAPGEAATDPGTVAPAPQAEPVPSPLAALTPRTSRTRQRGIPYGGAGLAAPAQSPYNYAAELVTTPLNARLALPDLIDLLEQKLAAMRGDPTLLRGGRTTFGGNARGLPGGNAEPVAPERPDTSGAAPAVGTTTAPVPARPF